MAFCALVVLSFFVAQANATPPAADQQITVTRFVIDGANALSASQLEAVKASVMGKRETSEVLLDTARHLLTTYLNNLCYIRATVDADVVNADNRPDQAWMHATVQQGVRYRLGNFRVQWAQAFSAQQIAQQLPLDAMRRDDCSGLVNVESTVADFYRSHGFRTVKVHPLVQANKATEQFDLTLYIDEAK